MKQKILKIATVLMIIATLTLANFILVCVDLVSIAAEAVSIDQTTNQKNVEVSAYFKGENGEKFTNADVNMNEKDLKMYFSITVKQEGYYNGKITLNKSNFSLKADKLSDAVREIKDNTITLNQINAGETKEIEVAIDLNKDDNYNIDLLNCESKFTVSGIYRDSKQKDIEVKAEKTVKANLIVPSDIEEKTSLSQNIITNKKISYNGEEKRIVQVEVDSKVNGNIYPIKKSTFNIQAPKLSNKYPEKVLINSNDILATNGENLTSKNYNYDAKKGTVTVEIENKTSNIKNEKRINWVKGKTDKFIVTYIFDKDVEISNQELTAKTQLEFYDAKTKIEKETKVEINNEEKDTLVSTKINYNEKEIYKGNLYFGKERDITYTNAIDINLDNITEEIAIVEEDQVISGTVQEKNFEYKLGAKYKETTISKEELTKILGEEGSLKITNTATNEEIAVLTSSEKEDENGNIVVKYPENVETIKITLENIKTIGKINLISTKTIKTINKEIAKQSNTVSTKTYGTYTNNKTENKIAENNKAFELKETATTANIKVSKKEFSTMTANKNVDVRITLNSRNESDELFKNPTLKLELPKKFETIKVNSIKLLNEKELKIVKQTQNANTIEIALEGEQTEYKGQAIEGSMIIVNLDLGTNKKASSSDEQIKLTYTNANAINYKDEEKIGTAVSNIKIVSYAGVITTNKIAEYGVETVNNAGTKEGKLELNTTSKTATIEKEIINNKENTINNVKILGTFPTKDAVSNTNNIDVALKTTVDVQGINENKVNVYYSENADATADLNNENNKWTETIENTKEVKRYLVTTDSLEKDQTVKLSYKVQVPEKLDYNQTAAEAYNVLYTDAATTANEKTKMNSVKLSTGKGAVVETNLKAQVGGKDTEEVKEGEIIKYVATLSNTGSETAENVKVTAKIPEGTTHFEILPLQKGTEGIDEGQTEFVKEDTNKKEITLNVNKLAAGEVKTVSYEVVVNKGAAGNKITNTVTTAYGETSKTSNTSEITVKEGNIKLYMYPAQSDTTIKIESGYKFIMQYTNITDKDIDNLKIGLNSEDFNITSIIYDAPYKDTNGTLQDGHKVAENEDEVEILKLKAGQTLTASFFVKTKEFYDIETKDVTVTAKVTTPKDTYYTNALNYNAVSYKLDCSVASETQGEYVKVGDTIEYKINVKNIGKRALDEFKILSTMSDYTSLVEIYKNGEKLNTEKYNALGNEIEIQDTLNVNEVNNYVIKEVVDKSATGTKTESLDCNVEINRYATPIAKYQVTHLLAAETNEDEGTTIDPENPSNPEDGSTSEDGTNTEGKTTTGTKIISGVAWKDSNENGQKDIDEELLSGITVKLLNVETGKIATDADDQEITAKTDEKGFYSLENIPNGKYIVIFEYDTTKYIVAPYEEDDVSNANSSKAITKTIEINGEEVTAACTDIIELTNKNVGNINLGLQEAKIFALSLDKYISKVVIQNSKGTKTFDFNNQTMAKAEMDAKLVNETTAVVEYTIKVTNEGEVEGYVKKIVDYLSKDYKFSSDMNEDWYQSGGNVYNTSLADEVITPGESKEVKITVTKQMSGSNTGLVTNTAKIEESYNEYGLENQGTSSNKVNGEADKAQADLILGIKTGQVVSTIVLILGSVAIISAGVYIVSKIVLRKKIIM